MRLAHISRSILVLIAVAAHLNAQSATRPGIWPGTWVASWATSQQIPEPSNALPVDDLRDATLRQIVHLSAGGNALRVHLSNAFGTAALHITSAHIARPLSPSSSSIDPATDKPLTFAGLPDVTIPPGAEFVSDPVEIPVPALSDWAITFHLADPPAQQTGHPGSRATSYYVHGDSVAAPTLTDPRHVDHWYNITGIDALTIPDKKGPDKNAPAATIIALGDSITDGHGATTNGNDRWTDILAARLQADKRTMNISVVNQGIGGNHLLTDGLGPNALARFDRDVLAPAGARWLIVLEGVNDLGGLTINAPVPQAEHEAFVARIIAAYQQIITRAHAHGFNVIGATVTPYTGSGYYHPDAANEADRQAVNTWIRATGHFDLVVDFDAAIRDPQQPDRILPAMDCGDHLHPDPAGYKAMGEAIPLEWFK